MSRFRSHVVASLALTLPLLAGCGGPDAGPGERTVDAEAVASDSGVGQPRLPDPHLGELERSDISLSIPWTTDRVDRDPTAGGDTVTVAAARYTRLEGVDRLVLEFDSAGAVPGYLARTTLAPVARCGSADSVAVSGAGLLVVDMESTRLAEAFDTASVSVAPSADLDNVTEGTLACARDGSVQWVLDVQRPTYYRLVEAEGPPRLVVDVQH